MSSQNVLLSLLFRPDAVVTSTPEPTCLVYLLCCLPECRVINFALARVRNEEGIVGVSSWVELWLEEGVEVPERTLNVPISLHLLESKLQQYQSELLSHLHERVEVTIGNFCT